MSEMRKCITAWDICAQITLDEKRLTENGFNVKVFYKAGATMYIFVNNQLTKTRIKRVPAPFWTLRSHLRNMAQAVAEIMRNEAYYKFESDEKEAPWA